MLDLPPGELHLWTFKLTALDEDQTCYRCLSADEVERAQRFRFDKNREEFVRARRNLRFTLASYLGCTPEDIQFEYGSRGKPRLTGNSHLYFNLSHSGGVAILAVTHDCDLGVDVEAIRLLPDLLNVAERFFCQEEYLELIALPDNQRAAAFFRCWTRKEAYIKAIGEGLAAPLDQFQVTLAPDADASFVHINQSREEAGQWQLHSFESGASFAAAVTYRHPPLTQKLMTNTFWP